MIHRWIQAYPGSRPAGCYLTGEIPPPTWRHELPALRHPVMIAGEVVIQDRGCLGREPELKHLIELGVVDAEEAELAADRLAGPRPTDHARYHSLAGD